MIIDIHVHTRFSPCGSIRVRQLERVIRESGIDGICITDHDTIAASSLLAESRHAAGVVIIVGLEYTTSQGDFLVFGPVESIPERLDAPSLARWAKKKGGVAIPAHPFRRSRPADVGILEHFHVIEAYNGRNRAFENDLCVRWLRERGENKKWVGGSDAHTLDEVGRVVTVFRNDIHTAEELVRELLEGTYTIWQRHGERKRGPVEVPILTKKAANE